MDAIKLRAKMYRKLLDEWQLSPYHCKIRLNERIGDVWVWEVSCDGITEYIKVKEEEE